jgi:osmotically-inducible protein OsmY
MKGRSRLIVIAAASFLLAFAASAQDATQRSNPTLTPLDQGNNKADLATTAEIRKEILDAKDMSVNAQNVKIITNGGKVTLRGPVNTAQEKQRIGEIAMKHASPANVDNQLEVKVTPNNSGATPPNSPKGQ